MLAEVWTIDNPAPGAWTMTGGSGRIYRDSTPVEALFEIEQGRFAFQKVDIALTIGGEGMLPSYPANFTLKGGLLIQPEGKPAQRVNLTQDPSNAGRFTTSYTPDSAVRHTVSLEVDVDSGELPSGLQALNSSFSAAPVRVIIEGLDSAERPLRGEPRTFQLHLLDTDGQPVPDIQVAQFQLVLPPIGQTACPPANFTATIENGLISLEPESLVATNPNSWNRTYTFPQSGLQLVCPLVQINDLARDQNARLTIRDYSSVVPLDIEQEQKVLLKLSMNATNPPEESTPDKRITYTYANPIFSMPSLFEPTEALVIVKTTLINESGVDSRDPAFIGNELRAAGEEPADYLCLIITGGGGRSLMKERGVRLSPTNDPSEWRVPLGVLPDGEYAVRVEARNIPRASAPIESVETSTTATGTFCEDETYLPDTGRIGNRNYRFDPRPVVLATLVVTTDFTPLWLTLGVIGVVGLIGYTGIVLPIKRRAGAVRGSLRIFRDSGRLMSIPLHRYGLNDIIVKAKDLPVVEPPIVQMRVKSGNGRITVTYAFDPDQPITVDLASNESHELNYTSWREGVYTITWVDSQD
jgi:hypothetical protein